MNNLVIREKYKNLLGKQNVYFNTFAKFCLRNIGSITESSAICGTKDIRENIHFRSQTKKNWSGVTLFIDNCISWISKYPHLKTEFNVAILSETKFIKPHPYRVVVENEDKFDLILTYDSTLLKRNPSKYKFVPADTATLGRKYWGLNLENKTRFASHIYSNKQLTEGHKLRQEVARALNKSFPGLVDMAGSGTGVYTEEKGDLLAPYLFSIVIENSNYSYYFTEKILDCFLSGTVPIYGGTSSIDNFFDAQGIIKFSDIDSLVKVLNELKKNPMKQYISRFSHVIANLALAEKYCFIDDFFAYEIISELEKRNLTSIISNLGNPQSNLIDFTDEEIQIMWNSC